MAFMNIFQADAFSVASMTDAINRVEYTPSRIGELGLFRQTPHRSDVIGIEEQEDGKLRLI